MEQIKPSKRLRRLQFFTTSLCIALIAINYIDRGTVAIANLSIRQEFGLSGTAIGGLISAWSLAYALSQLPAGFLVDRLGSRWMLAVATFVWSLAQAAGGLATSITQLSLSRALLGIGEAPAALGSARVTRNWYPPKERGLPTGGYIGATVLGPAIGPPILTVLMLAFGWRTMFLTMGAIGVVGAVIWYLVYRDIEDRDMPAEDRAFVRAGDVKPVTSISLRQWFGLFRYRTTWGLPLGAFGLGYMFWIYFGWLPAMLEMRYHVSIAQTGYLASLPWLGGIVGAICCGTISDWWAKRGYNPMLCRKVPTVLGLCCMAVFVSLMAQTESVVWALICGTFVVFFGIVSTTGLWALVTVLSPEEYTGSIASIPNCGAYLGATCSPIITGYLLDRTGSFEPGLLTGAAVGLVCAGFWIVMVRKPIQSDNRDSAAEPMHGAAESRAI
jgi:MFS family permease